ncbi:NADPH:quinone reductase [Paenibacillus sp. CCS19]|uniref:NADPH:quinone oxidoreductase family protein n=1 Tax=Paenibacillus sp. CCS19 TaxID=3158387 RepID=UPI00256E00E1|nr:NADPH:quinone oxidoreductase family protein [Paenibacillus cellulosilyticus]GMK41433.1 NADPH:quinone reductase [Paenibacillus cellulosilyticus]
MNIPSTMRALQQTTKNGPEDMRLITNASVPTPGPGEVLIQVTAAGINFADVMQTRGTYHNGPEAPYLAGFEAAGIIVALGEGTNGLALGTRVIGSGYGAYAEYMILSAAGVVPVPAGWTEEQSLGLILNWATALAALKPLGRIAAGETVLIHAAAGGVGQAAVKMAKHYGATVIATASPNKHAIVQQLGADHIIDYRNRDITAEILELTDGKGVDLVLESVGGNTFGASLSAAKRVTGRVVVFGAASGDAGITNWELIFKQQIHLIGLHIGAVVQHTPDIFGELMEELFTLIEAGVYTPGQPTLFDLSDGPKALAELEARSTVGKLALRPGG